MATMRDREEFDPDRQFVIVRAIRMGGVDYTAGQPFPKHVCETRKLRQLYDQRLVDMGKGEPAYRSPTAKFDVMTMDELRAWLTSHGSVPRVTWDRAKLLAKITVLMEAA